MSLRSVTRDMRTLPYPDMMRLAEELVRLLGARGSNSAQVADVLNKLAHMEFEEGAATQELTVLRKVFTRKTSITIQRMGNGFGASISAMSVSAQHTDPRVAVANCIESAMITHALKGE